MVRFGILGDTGDGKTLLSVDYGIEEKKDNDYNLFTNIPLKKIDHIQVYDTTFTDDIDESENNVIIIDEVGTISKGKCTFTFNDLVAQSRKSTGENQVFIMTAQVIQQTNNTLLGMVDFLIYPVILERDEFNRPYLIRADFYRRVKRRRIPYFINCSKQIDIDLRFRYVYDTCDYYSTKKEVKPLSDGRVYRIMNKYVEVLDKYPDITKKTLANLIEEKEGVSISESQRLANKILNRDLLKMLDGKNGEKNKTTK